MPKYVLDEKGILTITSEHDSGVSMLSNILKKVTAIFLIISIVASVGIYIFFYHDVPTTKSATAHCISIISSNSCSGSLKSIAKNSDLLSSLGNTDSEEETPPSFQRESLHKIFAKGSDLLSAISRQIEDFRQRWR